MRRRPIVSFCLGLFAMQLVLWLLSFGAMWLWFLGIDGIVWLTALFSLVLCYIWGYTLSKRIETSNGKPIVVLFLVWMIIPALIFFACDSGMVWSLAFPYRAIAQTLFSFWFGGHQSAFGLAVVRPLLIASSYMLTLLVFGVGVCVEQQGKPRNNM